MKFKAFSLIVVLFLIDSTILYGQTGGVTTAATAQYILNEAEASANSVLSKADYVLNSSITNAALNVLHIVAQTRLAMKDVLEDADKKLSKQQQDFFNNFNQLVANVTENINHEHDRVDQSMRELALYTTNTIFATKETHIAKFNFPQLIKTNDDKQIELIFNGIRLENEDNYLLLNDKKINPQVSNGTELRFIISKKELIANQSCQNISYATLKVHCFYDKGLFNKIIEKKYTFLVKLLPADIGLAKINYTIKYDKEEKRVVTKTGSSCQASGGGSRLNPHRGKCDQIINIFPDEGWKVDTDVTARVVRASNLGSCAGDCSHSISAQTPEAVRLSITCWSHSGRGENCLCRSDVKFTQKRTVKISENKTKELIVKSLNQIVIPLDKYLVNINSVQLIIYNINCELKNTEGSTESWVFTTKADHNEYFKVEFDNINKQVVLRPKMIGIY